MADSIRQRLVEKVKARLQTILTAGGFRTNAGSYVTVWKPDSVVHDQANLPAINVRDVDDEVLDANATGRLQRSLQFECDVVVAEGSDPADETARHVIADIQEAILVDETWDGLARLSRYLGDSIAMDQKERKIGMAQVRFEIRYHQERFNPDTQV